ncbi:hypothetical protein M408DRAFT_331067 [Serendipita vermifera MAFF 305830]|uniref:Uncharacterized protein n=1 Tax=Serendipita vermifera MAFF 305830 TaxID=933852 RepID=A0A0C2WH64_SERVB|nr:hypothetical protein M408DRAFT_331067 [Serendipita vermifera MAFF 305830]
MPTSVDQIQEEQAILLDEKEFITLFNLAPEIRTDPIEVYDMINPEPIPIIPPDYIQTCRALLNYLRGEKGLAKPDVWVRRMARHALTKDGISWKWVHPNKRVQGHLEFVDRAQCNFVDYIVVLKHQNDKDIPVPVGITEPDQPCCSQSDCGTVQKHLETLWAPCNIYVAKRIQYNEGEVPEDVLNRPFHTEQFASRHNDLCAYVS